MYCMRTQTWTENCLKSQWNEKYIPFVWHINHHVIQEKNTLLGQLKLNVYIFFEFGSIYNDNGPSHEFMSGDTIKWLLIIRLIYDCIN